MSPRLLRASIPALAALLLGACGGSSSVAVVTSPSPVAGALARGLIAYAGGGDIGVIDPATGKSMVVAPLPAGGAFRVAGPVWGPEPGVAYPVIYFAIHDDRPAERRTSPGVVPYDWLFRVDPFTGAITPLAASADFESEGPFGLAANAHYLALTVGCCTDYQVDVLDLTNPDAQVKVLTRPPDQPALFTEGAAPGAGGLVAVRGFATGAWYFLNPDLGVLNQFPLTPGPDDGPVAFSPDGMMAAVSLEDHGAVIEPVNLAPILASPSTGATGSPSAAGGASPSAKASPAASPVAPRRVNSTLPHVDALAWSPDARQLALAVNGGIQVYSAAGKDGDKPVQTFLATASVTGVDWSAAIPTRSLAEVKPAPNPETFVDALLDATKLPAAADNSEARPLTKVYLWAFDSSKASPIASITNATPDVLAKYPPLAATVNFHHWTASDTWALAGGCVRYRVVITGSVAPVATTIGLASNAPCLGAPSPSASPSKSPS
ncbi:MAG TPA: hypothetical protein VKT20_11225 [Candidatus Dormibacteraeota bacterium]|nr:hypothetical protein [Candidatus Dormibacteraeota bacterium]